MEINQQQTAALDHVIRGNAAGPSQAGRMVSPSFTEITVAGPATAVAVCFGLLRLGAGAAAGAM